MIGRTNRRPERSGKNCILGEIGWQRRSELDETGREAWELPNGTVLLLDPSGVSDSLVRRPSPEDPAPAPVTVGQTESERLYDILTSRWSSARRRLAG